MGTHLRDVSYARRGETERRAAAHFIQFMAVIGFVVGLGLGLVILYFDHR